MSTDKLKLKSVSKYNPNIRHNTYYKVSKAISFIGGRIGYFNYKLPGVFMYEGL